MRLWTIQPVDFWEASKGRGLLRADGRRLTHGRDFPLQYRWMREQIGKRLAGYGGKCPVWCWSEKPDMRMTCWAAGGTEVVRLEVEVPEERVLVSDFELWHFPLNNGYLSRNKADDEEFDAEVERRTGKEFARWHEEIFPEDLRERLLDSWERIFPDRWGEIEVEEEWHASPPGNRLQAIVEEISVGEVLRAEPFVTRHAEYERTAR